MPILTHPAFGPRTALGYVTGGALLCVWTLVWYFTRDHALSRSEWFWLSGFFLSGMIFILLGFTLGPLGRAARQAELPPPEALAAEANIQQVGAANPPPVAATPVGGAAVANPAVPSAPETVPNAPPGAVLPSAAPVVRVG